MVAFTVDWDEGAVAELRRLPASERGAVMNAAAKLEALGDQLAGRTPARSRAASPGSGSCGRARARSLWRVLYRRVAGAMVMLAVGPEAEHDRRGFDVAVRRAEQRL